MIKYLNIIISLFVVTFSLNSVLALSNSSKLSVAKNPYTSKNIAKVSFAPIIQKVSPAVVSIYASSFKQSRSRISHTQAYNHLFGNDNNDSYSIGSGVIIDKKGLIVTNAHVVKNRNNITVVLSDGREFKAKLIHINDDVDLALIRISSNNNFQYLSLDEGKDVKVGDLALAVGNPFGIGQTVTLGMVSGFRYFEGSRELGFGKLIQSDTSINPGNSGGALINSQGYLIGINSAIYSHKNQTYSNIGFSIPIKVVKLFVIRSLNGSRLKKYWLGLTGVSVDSGIAHKMGLEYPKGVYVQYIFNDGPASIAHVEPGDVIIGINNTIVNNISDLTFSIAKLEEPKSEVLSIIRKGQVISVEIIPGIPSETPNRDKYIIKKGILTGASFVNNSPSVAYEINTDPMTSGVVFYDVGNIALKKSRVIVGDFLVKINDHVIHNTNDIRNFIQSHHGNKYNLVLKRRDMTISINLTVDR